MIENIQPLPILNLQCRLVKFLFQFPFYNIWCPETHLTNVTVPRPSLDLASFWLPFCPTVALDSNLSMIPTVVVHDVLMETSYLSSRGWFPIRTTMEEYFYLALCWDAKIRLHNERESVTILFLLSLHRCEVRDKGACFENRNQSHSFKQWIMHE